MHLPGECVRNNRYCKEEDDDERVTVEDVDAFTEHYGMTPEEAASGNYVILTDDTEANESTSAATETAPPDNVADNGDTTAETVHEADAPSVDDNAAAQSAQEFSENSPAADETPAPPKKRGLFGRKK